MEYEKINSFPLLMDLKILEKQIYFQILDKIFELFWKKWSLDFLSPRRIEEIENWSKRLKKISLEKNGIRDFKIVLRTVDLLIKLMKVSLLTINII